MKVTPDTNILVRSIVHDDDRQSAAAIQLIHQAEVLALSITCLCELVWVLRSGYKVTYPDIEVALLQLANAINVVIDRQALEAGLIFVRNNRDFADGVIAHEGRSMGGETFATFDKKAVALITSQGYAATLVS